MKDIRRTLADMESADRKLLVWGGGAILAVLVLFVVFVATNGFGSGTPPNSAVEELASNPQTASAAMISEANAGKYDVTCTYEKVDSSGMIYVTKAASRYTSETADGTVHVLRVSTYMYIWNDKSNDGIVYDVGTTSDAELSDLAQYDTSEYAQEAEQNKLQCQKVDSLDASLFSPPGNIAFTPIAAGD